MTSSRKTISVILDGRCNYYKNKINNTKIEDYFGIISKKNETISYSMEKEIEHCVFTAKYVTQNTPNNSINFVGLPKELCDLIATFSCKMIQIKFNITYPELYPFEPPIWSLLEENNDMNHLPRGFVLKEYYQDIVERHNSQYNNSGGFNWTPAIDIRVDMLGFIEKINHFEMISEYYE